MASSTVLVARSRGAAPSGSLILRFTRALFFMPTTRSKALIAHIGRIDRESQKHAHFINSSVYFDIVRVVNQRLHDVIQKLHISFIHISL